MIKTIDLEKGAYQFDAKMMKLAQMGNRVFGIPSGRWTQSNDR